MEDQSEKTGNITKSLLKSRSGEFDIESIHSLNLQGLSLSDLGCLGECSGIERLNLSQNDLTRLHPLASLTNLIHLNLSANRISCLEGLQTLDNLVSLNIAGNLIGSVDTLRCLSDLEKLTELRLQNPLKELTNPVCMGNGYRTTVLDILPKLLILDGETISGKGSEMYKTCGEIETLLKVLEQASCDVTSEKNCGPWINDDFWAPTEAFEQSSLADAETDLKNLLEQCKQLNEEGDQKLEEALKDASVSLR